MTTKTFEQVLDDIELAQGREIKATNPVEIELSGWGRIQLDLNDGNLGVLQDALRPYFAAGTKVAPSTGRSSAKKSTARRAQPQDNAENQQIREWARAEGMKVSERGRIPRDVVAAYHNRGQGSPAPVQSQPADPDMNWDRSTPNDFVGV